MTEQEHKIILQQIVSEHGYFRQWIATCRCGWHAKDLKKECTLMAEEHGCRGPEHLMTGPKIITVKMTVAIPRREFPSDRWVWHAWNDCDEGEPWFHGLGRSEDEAIGDLLRTDDVRRMARFNQSEGFPRNAAWLDFFKYEPAERADKLDAG
jgi:hypothetical protein